MEVIAPSYTSMPHASYDALQHCNISYYLTRA